MKNLPVFETIELWRQEIENPNVEGLYVDTQQILMLDRRAKMDSAAYCLVGPRTVDMNLAGPERIVVPGDVMFSYIQEAIKLRLELRLTNQRSWTMGIH